MPDHSKFQRLLKRLQDNDPTLTTLHFGSNEKMSSLIDIAKLTDDDARALAEALASNTKVQNLYIVDLINNVATDSVVKALESSGITNMIAKVFGLDITAKALLPFNLEKLIEIFKGHNVFDRNSSICNVSISWCNLDDVGAQAIANAISGSRSLQNVTLSGYGISDAGAQAIANAISRSSSIQSVDLSHNSIDATGGQAIANALMRNLSIRTLKLPQNGYKAIQQIIENEITINSKCQEILTQRQQEMKTMAEIRGICTDQTVSLMPNELLFEIFSHLGTQTSSTACNQNEETITQAAEVKLAYLGGPIMPLCYPQFFSKPELSETPRPEFGELHAKPRPLG